MTSYGQVPRKVGPFYFCSLLRQLLQVVPATLANPQSCNRVSHPLLRVHPTGLPTRPSCPRAVTRPRPPTGNLRPSSLPRASRRYAPTQDAPMDVWRIPRCCWITAPACTVLSKPSAPPLIREKATPRWRSLQPKPKDLRISRRGGAHGPVHRFTPKCGQHTPPRCHRFHRDPPQGGNELVSTRVCGNNM